MTTTNFGVIVTLYCEGKKHEPHIRRLVDAYDQFNRPPHYWKPVQRVRWRSEGRSGRLPRNRQTVERKLGEREQANRLTSEQAWRATFGGTSAADDLWVRWRFTCNQCGYELRRNFGVINAEFDRLAQGSGFTMLLQLESDTKDH